MKMKFKEKLFCSIVIVYMYFILVMTSNHFFGATPHYFQHSRDREENHENKGQLEGLYRFKSITEKENKSKQCQICKTNVPNLIIQYGCSRTASTLQFQILCIMMAFLHEDDLNNVGCYYHNTVKRYKYSVVKTHDVLELPMTIPSDSWMFVTSSDAMTFVTQLYQNYSMREMRRKNITIPYVADVKLVSKRGHFIAYEYQHFFGMSDVYMQHIVEYLRYWDKLRLCCGRQMSEYWRSRLISNTTYFKLRRKHSPTYSACEMYNISQVERLLLKTFIFKKFGRIDSLRDVIAKPSTFDGEFDGSYCERCIKNIIAKQLPFNVKCV